MLKQELYKLGLKGKEADTYLAALQLGFSSVQDLAEQTGFNRTSVYGYIKNLISRGLIRTQEKTGKVYYVAESPTRLIELHEKEEKELKKKKEMLDDLLPQLESLYNLAKDKPEVKFFEHDKDEVALQKMRDHLLTIRGEEVYNLFSYNHFRKYTSKKHIAGILKNFKRMKALYISDQKIVDRIFHEFTADGRLIFKHLPASKFDFRVEISVFNEHVCISRGPDTLLIKDRFFANTFVLLFKALWELAEDFD